MTVDAWLTVRSADGRVVDGADTVNASRSFTPVDAPEIAAARAHGVGVAERQGAHE